jgi:hypothetical protein
MKKSILIVLCLFVSIIGVFLIKYENLVKTNLVPYHNLTKYGTNYFYIYSNICFNNKNHVIVCGNTQLFDLLSRKKNIFLKIRPVYALYLNEIIKNNLSIAVNEQLYNELQFAIVKEEFVLKHNNYKTIDFIIASDGKFPENLCRDDINAIIYILLKKGINCQNICTTGEIEILFPEKLPK